ncbi:hypothetical protein V8F06_012401 [Rhypophila decipiens]
MTWGASSLGRILVLGLLSAQGVLAESDAKADHPKGGSKEGLAYEEINKKTVYSENATAPAAGSGALVPPVDGWWYSKVCADKFCIFTNRRLANGRGMVMVTTMEDYQKVERQEDAFNKADNKFQQEDGTFETVDLPDRGTALKAKKAIRRGKPVMSWTPALVVHKDVFDVLRRKERTRILDTAVRYLPDETQAKFNKQRKPLGPLSVERSIESVMLSSPFEYDLGYNYNPEMHSKHILNFPEINNLLPHDCRPNVAWYIDGGLTMRTVVARRINPGDELTVAYIDPFIPRPDRSLWVKNHRGFNKPCPCQACTHGGDAEAVKKADARLEELNSLFKELKNHDSKKVTPQLIARFLDLVSQERLQVKLADAYEYAALNYNYIGMDRLAKKYADLAVQAAMVEEGHEANNVIALRIMAGDIKGHYSYQYTLKRQGKVKS